MAIAISVMAAALANNTKPAQDMDRDILAQRSLSSRSFEAFACKKINKTLF